MADDAKIVSLDETRVKKAKAPKGAACPICSKVVMDKVHAPFCSAHCKKVDLGRWLTESYRVETDERPMPGGQEDEGNY